MKIIVTLLLLVCSGAAIAGESNSCTPVSLHTGNDIDHPHANLPLYHRDMRIQNHHPSGMDFHCGCLPLLTMLIPSLFVHREGRQMVGGLRWEANLIAPVSDRVFLIFQPRVTYGIGNTKGGGGMLYVGHYGARPDGGGVYDCLGLGGYVDSNGAGPMIEYRFFTSGEYNMRGPFAAVTYARDIKDGENVYGVSIGYLFGLYHGE